MKKIILCIFTAFTLVGCCKMPTKSVEIQTETKIEYIEKIVKDTVEVVLEKETYVNVLPQDSTSFLQTKYAESTASLENGMLNHTLSNKNVPIEIPIEYIEVEKIVEKEIIKTEVNTVEVKVKVVPFWCYMLFIVIGLLLAANWKRYLSLFLRLFNVKK